MFQTARIADTLDAFWQAERTSALSAGPGNWLDAPADTLRGEAERGRFSELVQRWAEQTEQLDDELPVQLLDRNGRPLVASVEFSNSEPLLSPATVQEALGGRTVYETARLPDRRIRAITRPVFEGDSVLYVVRAAAPLEPVDDSLARLRVVLLWLVPLTLLVASAIGWFLGNVAMRPLGRMITQAQRIGVGRLHERIEVPESGDELQRLAKTFNDMLGRLEEGLKRIRQFSAAASHELRTPLTIMQGELEVALRKPRTPEEYRGALRLQLEAAGEMTHTVEELLMLARSEASSRTIDWRPVELGELVDRVSDAWQPVAKAKGVRLDIPYRESLWVRAESRLLDRVIANLLDNAIRHTPAEGMVTVWAERHHREACLTVHDTGPGIPAEELPHIFDRFFKKRAAHDGSSHGSSPSTGLGLGLCRWIVEAHYGRIEVTSPPGRGAAITVWLPSCPPPA